MLLLSISTKTIYSFYQMATVAGGLLPITTESAAASWGDIGFARNVAFAEANPLNLKYQVAGKKLCTIHGFRNDFVLAENLNPNEMGIDNLALVSSGKERFSHTPDFITLINRNHEDAAMFMQVQRQILHEVAAQGNMKEISQGNMRSNLFLFSGLALAQINSIPQMAPDNQYAAFPYVAISGYKTERDEERPQLLPKGLNVSVPGQREFNSMIKVISKQHGLHAGSNPDKPEAPIAIDCSPTEFPSLYQDVHTLVRRLNLMQLGLGTAWEDFGNLAYTDINVLAANNFIKSEGQVSPNRVADVLTWQLEPNQKEQNGFQGMPTDGILFPAQAEWPESDRIAFKYFSKQYLTKIRDLAISEPDFKQYLGPWFKTFITTVPLYPQKNRIFFGAPETLRIINELPPSETKINHQKLIETLQAGFSSQIENHLLDNRQTNSLSF